MRKEFKNIFYFVDTEESLFYRLHTLKYLCVFAYFARNSFIQDTFRHSCVEKASYRVVDVKYHAKSAKTQSFFFRARRVLEYLFFLDTYTDLFYCRVFIFLISLRLCALCEKFFYLTKNLHF